MQITVEIPDALAGQLHLGAKADLRTLLQALVKQQVEEGGFTVVQVGENWKGDKSVEPTRPSVHQMEAPTTTLRPRRDVLSRLQRIYGDLPLSGENAVLAARKLERF